MAEAIIPVVMEQLVCTIRLGLEQEVRLLVGVRKEVSKLSSTLGFIKTVLDDAEKKQFHETAVKAWMGALKDIMYDVDDVLDEWYTTISFSQSQHMGAASGSRTTNKVLSFFSSPCSCFQPVVLRRDIALSIKDIRARLDDVARNKDQLNLIQCQSHQDNCPRQLTSSIVDVSEIQGRDDDKASILGRVLAENSEQGAHAPVPVICIVGMGGLGKTTLAQLVFKDEQVTTTFEPKIWVCVSEPFNLERVAREIIEQASGENVQNVLSWEVVHQRVCSSVRGKRFLLVLDDVWTENPGDWTPLKDSLDGGAAGSRIIITTRSEGVAKIVSASYIHLLKELSEDHCWSLFRHIAFQGRSQQETNRLEEIGREIARKCKGVPLAAKTVGSLMRFKQTKQEWRSILQSDIWELGKDFFPALQLSYHSLPAHLKQCFLYTAIFPKDKKLKKDRLVKLWMAQGFIRSLGGIEPEIVAGEYFDDLVMRSFFQDFERDGDGKVIYCKMHDFLHDVAQSLTKDECHIMETNDNGLTNYNKVRHVNASNAECSSPFVANNLRTLMLKSSTPTQVLKQSFLQSTCLRALDLHGRDLIELPDKVQCLVHMRYLDLSGTMLSILPEKLCNLYNLQTLKLNKCLRLGRLPEGIGRLSNLRHLEVEDTLKLEYIPQSIGKLSQLRTLHKFVVSGASMGCTVGELRQLNSLSGGLRISQFKQVENVDESKGAQMLKKEDLGSLQLNFGYNREEQAAIEIEEVKRMEGVLEGLQPNANLEKLEIDSYPGLTFPLWMSLCNLTTMTLCGCRNCNQLPAALGRLPSLEKLHLEDLDAVKHVGADLVQIPNGSAAARYEEASTLASLAPNVVLFPKLTKLTLENFPEWTEEGECEKIQEITKIASIMLNLQELDIKKCPKLKVLPPYMFPHSLRILALCDCPQLKVIPCLPPLLEKIELWGDLGVVSTSLMSSSCDHDYPNLKIVEIYCSPHSSLLQGLSKFTSLQKLKILRCDFLDLKPEEVLRGFPVLQQLIIFKCPVIRERCEREDWENTLSSHIAYNIEINITLVGVLICFTKRR